MNTVFVLTYNTRDDYTRRMVAGVYTTREKAKKGFEKIKRTLGDFVCDYEINEMVLDA